MLFARHVVQLLVMQSWRDGCNGDEATVVVGAKVGAGVELDGIVVLGVGAGLGAGVVDTGVDGDGGAAARH